MHKNRLTVFVALLFLISAACYKNQSGDTNRTARTTPAAQTPLTETSASPVSTPAPKSGGNYEQALSDYKAKNYEKAEKGFKEVIDAEPAHARAHFYLGSIYHNRKAYDEALPHLETAARIDFKSTETMMLLGDNYRALQRYDKAIVHYQKITGFEPENANAYYAMGLTYIGLNNKIGARQQLQKLTPLNKDLAKKLADAIGD